MKLHICLTSVASQPGVCNAALLCAPAGHHCSVNNSCQMKPANASRPIQAPEVPARHHSSAFRSWWTQHCSIIHSHWQRGCHKASHSLEADVCCAVLVSSDPEVSTPSLLTGSSAERHSSLLSSQVGSVCCLVIPCAHALLMQLSSRMHLQLAGPQFAGCRSGNRHTGDTLGAAAPAAWLPANA